MSHKHLAGLIAWLLFVSLAHATPGSADDDKGLALQPHPLWVNSGQPEPFGAALSVAASDDVVVASGNVCDDVISVLSCNWFVRAIDKRSGGTLWEDRINAGLFDRSQSVEVADGRVFASGWFQRPFDPVTGRGLFNLVVRAYDATSGTLLWQHEIDRGPFDFAEKLTVSNGRVFVVGRVFGPTHNNDFSVFAFDAATGAELWESVTDIFRLDIAFVVRADRDMVFAAGPVRSGTSVLVRAYDAATGTIRWEDEISGGRMFVTQQQLALQDSSLYLAAGILNPSGDEDSIVRAYDTDTGVVKWTQQWDGGGNDEAFAVTAAADRVFVGGEEGADANFLSGFFAVRALDAKTGRILWQDQFQTVPSGDSFAQSILVLGGRVFAGGGSLDSAGDYLWTLRVYEERSGELVFAGQNGVGLLNALAADEDHVYAVGFVAKTFFNAPGSFDVRAYATDDHESGDQFAQEQDGTLTRQVRDAATQVVRSLGGVKHRDARASSPGAPGGTDQ